MSVACATEALSDNPTLSVSLYTGPMLQCPDGSPLVHILDVLCAHVPPHGGAEVAK